MRKSLLFIIVFAFLQTDLFPQISTARIDNLLTALNSRDLAFGNVVISKAGKIIYQKALGYSRISADTKTLSTTQTRYRIGSVSKVFTAVMIFQLVEEGKIKADQTLSLFFPDLPGSDKITLAHLLNHQSGLHDYTKDTGFEGWMDKPKSQAELLTIIRDKGPDFEPGTKTEYCNSNYLLLSYILEKRTGMSYEKNLQVRILSKTGLTNTYLAKAINPMNNESVSYKYANGTWNSVPETDPGIHAGAGAIVSTPSDLVLLIEALFNNKLIKKSSLEKMITLTNGYGMGIFPYDHGTTRGYGHNGRIEEFYTAVRYYPESRIAVAYCTNGINYPRVDILEGIIKSCFNESMEIPFASREAGNLSSYPGQYAADSMPIVVAISLLGKKIIAETQGKEFELEPVSTNYYMHPPTGYYFEFFPEQDELLIKETDNVYFLKKK
jgi:CubicO group peptidase (beta-lactamase class C family)